MRQRFVVLIHAGYWSIYALLLVFLLVILGARSGHTLSPLTALFTSWIGFVLIVPNVLAFYTSYLLLFPYFLARKRFALLALGGILGAMGSAAACIPAFYYGVSRAPRSANISPDELVWTGACLMGFALVHMIIALVMHGFIHWYNDIAINEELRRRTSEIETALLRSKLDPHFLFNTLNNIDVLISKDAAAASRYLNQLSEILRFVLYEARAERIPLQAELAYVDKYIALQRIRMSRPHYVVWEVRGDPTDLMIAPMLLIPFIENAFKHVAGQWSENAIRITVSIEGKRVDFQCRNRYSRKSNSVETAVGIGNEVMQRRLTLLYPGRHQFAVFDQDDLYTVRLMLNLEEYALHHS